MSTDTRNGLTITPGEGMTRVKIGCQHQQGLIYVVPAEKSWVCSSDLMPGHALAGFLRELTDHKDVRVQDLMKSWGLYFRQLPLDEEDSES